MHITPEIVDQRKRLSPPLQVPCKYGGVFLRDMRLWHAGERVHQSPSAYLGAQTTNKYEGCQIAPTKIALCSHVATQLDGTNALAPSKCVVPLSVIDRDPRPFVE